jgi:hypothetical protein
VIAKSGGDFGHGVSIAVGEEELVEDLRRRYAIPHDVIEQIVVTLLKSGISSGMTAHLAGGG